MIVRLLLPALAISLSCAVWVAACNNGGGSSGNVGDLCTQANHRCATPTCSDFPTNTGCDDVAPYQGYCPIDRSHCFDPTTAKGYCNGNIGVCFKPISPSPGNCPVHYCAPADVSVCNTADTTAVFCRGDYICAKYEAACGDGGVVIDMAAAGEDMATAASMDLSMGD